MTQVLVAPPNSARSIGESDRELRSLFMAVFDTHKAVKTLTGAGFSETQAEALMDVVGEG